MNILIFSWRGPGHPNAGGAEISTHEHAKTWVDAGHNVTLFTSSYRGAKSVESLDEIKILQFGNQTLGVQLEAIKWYLFKTHPKFDIVVDQFHGIPFFTPLFVNVKKIAFIHEVAKEVWRFNPWQWPLNLIPWIIGTALEPIVFRFLYSRIPFMTVSESTRRDLVSWGIPRQNITVIHNGVSIPSKYLLKKDTLKTVIYLGTLTRDKGIEKALEVFHLLQKKLLGKVQFWVVGKGSGKYINFLKLKVKKLGIKKIKFWGYAETRKKFELLARAHILLNPSIREGWGLVVIEAAAMGTPTVAFNVVGLRDSIINGKTGLLCSELSADGLADITYRLLESKQELEKMSKNALRWSKKFSWDKSGRKSLKLMEQIVTK